MDRTPERDRLLVAVDVDGTLLDTEFDDVLGARELAALAAVRDAGHMVALCTGRNLPSVTSLLETSGWFPDDLPLVLLNGALVLGGLPRRQLACNVLEGPLVAPPGGAVPRARHRAHGLRPGRRRRPAAPRDAPGQ